MPMTIGHTVVQLYNMLYLYFYLGVRVDKLGDTWVECFALPPLMLVSVALCLFQMVYNCASPAAARLARIPVRPMFGAVWNDR